MKIIKLNLETHNTEDCYYTYMYSKLFFCINKTEEQINIILNSIIPTEYLNTEYSICGYNEIDVENLVDKLKEYEIFEFNNCINHCYYLKEECE